MQVAKTFWKAWHDFEVHHGNEDTFREMLRIKRSVQAQFSTQVNFVSVQMLAAAAGQEAGNKAGYCFMSVHRCILALKSIYRIITSY